MSSPKLVAFQTMDKARNRYLGNVDDTDPVVKRFLAFTADEALSPLARFKIETTEGGLVQIRSCFTNKLWSRSSSNENWIVTTSDEQVRDKSNWGCTLFKLNIKGTTVTFTHVQLRKQLILKTASDGVTDLVCVDSGLSSAEPLKATFIDLTSLVKLPKYITFKANDKFLSVSELDHERYEPGYGWSLDRHQFITFSLEDPLKIETLFEVIQNHDGSICLKYVKSGKLWGVWETSKGWITLEHENKKEIVESSEFRFNPIRVSDGPVIALQSVYNSKYCKRATEIHPESLSAISPLVKDSERILVMEPVTKRKVEVTRLRIEDLIILSESSFTVDTKKVDDGQTVEFKSEGSESLMWSKSVSLVTDLTFSIESPTPYYDLVDKAIKPSKNMHSADNYKWGTKQKSTYPVTKTLAVNTPPRTTITAKLKARRLQFQIPFDYIQTDALALTGETKTCTNLQDGLYTGEFLSDFYIEIGNEKL